jgi:hypothetical protein
MPNIRDSTGTKIVNQKFLTSVFIGVPLQRTGGLPKLPPRFLFR